MKWVSDHPFLESCAKVSKLGVQVRSAILELAWTISIIRVGCIVLTHPPMGQNGPPANDCLRRLEGDGCMVHVGKQHPHLNHSW